MYNPPNKSSRFVTWNKDTVYLERVARAINTLPFDTKRIAVNALKLEFPELMLIIDASGRLQVSE